MPSNVVKKCKSCGYEVDPQHTGKCPNCGNIGYNVAVTLNEVVEVSDKLNVTKNTLNKAYDGQLEKFEKKIKEEEDAKKKRVFEITKQKLASHKQRELNKISERLDVLNEVKKKPETHKKTFTIDAVLVESPPTQQEVTKSVENYVKLSSQEALEQMSNDIKTIKKTTSETHTKVSMLSSKKTLFLGFTIGAGGSSLIWFLTTILPDWIKNIPPIVIVNSTNSTI